MEARKLNKENIILNHLYKTCYNYKQAHEVYKLIKEHINNYDMICNKAIEGDTILTVIPTFKKAYNIKPLFNGFKIIKGLIIITDTEQKTLVVRTNNFNCNLTPVKEKEITKIICLRKKWDNEELRKMFKEKREKQNECNNK